MALATDGDYGTGGMGQPIPTFQPTPPPSTSRFARSRPSAVQYNPSDELQSTILSTATPYKYTPYSGSGGMGGFDPESFNNPKSTAYKTKYATVLSQLQTFDSFSHKEFTKLRNMMAAAGFVSEDAAPVETRAAYAAMLVNMSQEGIALTPDDYLKNLIRMSGQNPNALGGSGKRKRWKTVNTQRTIYELDSTDAKQMMVQTMQQYLGRDPTPEEIQDFKHAVNTEAADDPSVTRSTTQYRKGGKRSTTTREVVDSGFTQSDAIQQAMDEAKESPDYGEYQAVSTYFPVVEDLLNASVAI